MRTLYLDCSTGVSGDMLLAALTHAADGLIQGEKTRDFLEKRLKSLGIEGFQLEWVDKRVGGIQTLHVDVVQTLDQPLRTFSDLSNIVASSDIPNDAANRALSALRLLGEAEAKVHGVDLESVHFHEIGAVDTVVDIVGAMLLTDCLDVSRVVVSPIDLGSGFVRCAHGKMPVPAPACAELSRSLVTFGSDCGMERATPTGLAVARTLADSCGPLPMGRVLAVGYGSGGRSSDEQPTYVRAFVLESVAEELPDRESDRA